MIIKIIKITADAKKSKKAAPIDDSGKISLGKNTFVTRLLLLTTERLPNDTEFEKNVQGISEL